MVTKQKDVRLPYIYSVFDKWTSGFALLVQDL